MVDVLVRGQLPATFELENQKKNGCWGGIAIERRHDYPDRKRCMLYPSASSALTSGFTCENPNPGCVKPTQNESLSMF